jgi:hypothetical protein
MIFVHFFFECASKFLTLNNTDLHITEIVSPTYERTQQVNSTGNNKTNTHKY